MPEYKLVPTNANQLAALGSTQVYGEEATQRIKDFASAIFHEHLPASIDLNTAKAWLYDKLPYYQGFIDLYRICREGAKSYSEIKTSIFADACADDALDALLVIVSMAEKDDNLLFPVRLHMFVREDCRVFTPVQILIVLTQNILTEKSYHLARLSRHLKSNVAVVVRFMNWLIIRNVAHYTLRSM